MLFWRVMRSQKPSKKRSARKKKALGLSKSTQSPFKTRKIGKKECVLGTDPRRVAAILAGLDEMYPHATCELKHANPFQLLVSTILSAQCTDVRVNEVTESLYKKYPKPEAFAYATQNSQRSPGHSLRYRCGRGSGYPCDQIIATLGLIAKGRAHKNRAGSDGGY